MNLYWKTSKGKTVNLVETPFKSEVEFEKYIFENQELLEDIFIFKRQVRSGSHQGVPDMLGVDQDGKVCLIEMKNALVMEDILPQLLKYAIWAETSPDSIKALWLEAEDRPEDVTINWEAVEIRLLVVGPEFRINVLRMSHKIGYDVDLLQVKRFVSEDEEFIIVEQMEEEPQPRIVITKGMEVYDRDFYEREHGKEATAKFLNIVSQIEGLIKKHGWQLQTKINKYYTGFKYGNRNPFGVHWGGTHAWQVFIKLPESVAKHFTSSEWEVQRYEASFKQALFKPLASKPKLDELEELMVDAYEKLRGKT